MLLQVEEAAQHHDKAMHQHESMQRQLDAALAQSPSQQKTAHKVGPSGMHSIKRLTVSHSAQSAKQPLLEWQCMLEERHHVQEVGSLEQKLANAKQAHALGLQEYEMFR